MKKSFINNFKLLAIVLSFLSISVATAADSGEKEKLKDGEKITETANITYSIYPIINTNKVRVAYKKVGNMAVTVKIYNAQMNLLYTDKQKNDAYLKRNYDLGKVGSGEYVIQIEAGDYKTVQRVKVGQPQKQEFLAFLSPELINKKLRVAYQHATDPVSMFIYDKSGSLIYKKRLDDQNYSSLFNLDSLKRGTYTIVVKSGNSSTEQTYSLQ